MSRYKIAFWLMVAGALLADISLAAALVCVALAGAVVPKGRKKGGTR